MIGFPQFWEKTNGKPKLPFKERALYGLFLRNEYSGIIQRSKNWPERCGQMFGDELEITRQAANLIKKGVWPCSPDIIIRIKHLMNLKACWCFAFEDRIIKTCGHGDPKFNMVKYRGEMPYSEHSPTGEFRAKDMI